MSKRHRNIIFILIDGARYDFVSLNETYLKLFDKSIWFKRVYTTAPYTIASMHAMFTGLYPKKNGVNGYLKPGKLKESIKTIPQYLKEKNYFTICNIPSPVVMADRGFDRYEVHDEYKFGNSKEHLECIRRYEKEMKKSENFFIYLHYSHIHTSLSNRVLKKYDDFSDEYFNNIEENRKKHFEDVWKSADYLEGIIKYLKESSLLVNTDLWIASDHGVSCGERVGEKAYGVYLYDYTLHTFLIKYKEEKKSEDNEFRSTIDTLPIIFESANIGIPENLDGKISRRRVKKSIFWERMEYEPIFLETGGVGGPFPSPEKHNIYGILTEKKKLIHNRTIDKYEEYEYSNSGDKPLSKIDSDLKKQLTEYERDI